MSAYLVSDATIDAIITYGLRDLERRCTIGPVKTASELGQTLVNENYRSVNARYSEDTEPHRYTFKPFTGHLSAVQVLKLCQCYKYQACEHEGWEDSKAKEMISDVISKAIHNLPGYDAAEWGLDDSERSNAVCLSDLMRSA